MALSEQNQKTIRDYKLHQACSLLYWITDKLSDDHEQPKSKLGIDTFLRSDALKLPDLEKLDLIRALCDQIEFKLIEQAG